jgi:hypothetical protein
MMIMIIIIIIISISLLKIGNDNTGFVVLRDVVCLFLGRCVRWGKTSEIACRPDRIYGRSIASGCDP